jgi:hypothetical protein
VGSGRGENVLQILIALVGIAALLALLLGGIYGVAGLVAIAMRYAPLVGRRPSHRARSGRKPVETESSQRR